MSPQTKQGERFDTATDTEVIPKLCKYVYNNFTRSVTFSQACPGPARNRHPQAPGLLALHQSVSSTCRVCGPGGPQTLHGCTEVGAGFAACCGGHVSPGWGVCAANQKLKVPRRACGVQKRYAVSVYSLILRA